MRETGLTVETVTQTLERLIPPACAASGESVGLQVGDPSRSVTRVHVVRWITREILRHAVRKEADLLITYQPVSGKLRAGSVETQLLQALMRTNIAVYAVGSSIDSHPQSPSRVLAERLALENVRPVLPRRQAGLAKIVTFVPRTHTDAVRSALADAGAGQIGEYELCSYRSEGEGSFRGSERTKPFVGTPGRLEYEEEDRLEMVLPLNAVPDAVKSLWKAHPYDEPAYDIYTLHDVRDPRQTLWIGEVKKPLSWPKLGERVSEVFPDGWLSEGSTPDRRKRFRHIACTATDASELIPHCVKEEADALICLGLDDHAARQAAEYKLPCIILNRHVLDDLFRESIRAILGDQFQLTVA